MTDDLHLGLVRTFQVRVRDPFGVEIGLLTLTACGPCAASWEPGDWQFDLPIHPNHALSSFLEVKIS